MFAVTKLTSDNDFNAPCDSPGSRFTVLLRGALAVSGFVCVCAAMSSGSGFWNQWQGNNDNNWQHWAGWWNGNSSWHTSNWAENADQAHGSTWRGYLQLSDFPEGSSFSESVSATESGSQPSFEEYQPVADVDWQSPQGTCSEPEPEPTPDCDSL